MQGGHHFQHFPTTNQKKPIKTLVFGDTFLFHVVLHLDPKQAMAAMDPKFEVREPLQGLQSARNGDANFSLPTQIPQKRLRLETKMWNMIILRPYTIYIIYNIMI